MKEGYAEQELAWDGSERRSIPFQIVNYIDEKLMDHAKSLSDALNSHTSEEMERYQDIIDKQDQLENKICHMETLLERNGDRMVKLNESILSWTEKQQANCATCRDQVIEKCEIIVDEAIPSPPNDPDATPREKRKGHRKAHASLIDQVQQEMESWAKIRQKVKEWAIIGALGMLGLAIWQFLLHGPK